MFSGLRSLCIIPRLCIERRPVKSCRVMSRILSMGNSSPYLVLIIFSRVVSPRSITIFWNTTFPFSPSRVRKQSSIWTTLGFPLSIVSISIYLEALLMFCLGVHLIATRLIELACSIKASITQPTCLKIDWNLPNSPHPRRRMGMKFGISSFWHLVFI